MNMIRLTKEFAFEMSHALEGYDGACKNIHGHSYKLFVTVKGVPVSDTANPKFGMVMDFGVLKNIVNTHIVDRYDHALVIYKHGNEELIEQLRKKYDRVIGSAYQPTCENLLCDFAGILTRELPKNVNLHSLKLHETATSFAEWFAEDNI